MKRKLLSLLVLLMTAISCAWAQGEYQQGEYLYLDISGTTATLYCSPSKPSSGIPCYYHNFNTSWYDNGYNGFGAFRSSCTEITVDASCNYFNGKDLSGLFKDFGALTTISGIGNLNTSSVTGMGHMFFGCSSLTTLDLSGWVMSSVNSMFQMFTNCKKLTTLNLSNWNTGSVYDMCWVFYGCTELTTITGIESLNTSSVYDMNNMFSGCENLTSLDLSGWNTANFNTMSGLFEGCKNLSSLNLSGWNTAKVGSMDNMFSGCKNLSSLNLSGWNTAEVVSMYQMFAECKNLSSLNLSGWNTAKVIYMDNMFSGCSNLSSLDLSEWNTAYVEFMSGMFNGCQKLEKIYVGDGWSTESVTDNDNGNDMFFGCTRLPGWNSAVTDVSMAKTTDKGGYLTIATYNLTAKQGATDEYWATFYSEMSNYQASAGTQVFAVKLIDTEITMIQITDGIVKSGEGVVLKNTSGSSITMTPTDEAGTGNYSDNSLVGTKIAITNPGNAYVLNKGEAGIGFYKLKDTGTIGANKAYLIYPDPQAGTGNTREFFGFEEATGLKAIDNGQLTIDNVVYDLQGRRVSQPTKGFYIVNGKKVVIK